MKYVYSTRILIALLSFIVIGFAIILTSLSRFQSKISSQSFYQISVNRYSLSFSQSILQKPVFKISPLDDYYYYGSTKDHIADSTTFTKIDDTNDKLEILLENMFFGDKRVKWTTLGNNGIKISYLISDYRGDSVKITRRLSNLKDEVYAIGQSIVLCDDCILIDQFKRVYFNGGLLSEQKLNLAQSLGLTPVILTSGILPTDVSEISILDLSANPKIVIPIFPNQQILYDERWHLLELKTFINDKGKAELSQVVRFIR